MCDECGCSANEPEIACTLAAEDRPARVAEWRALLGKAKERESVDGGIRLTFAPDPGLAAEVANLAQREQGCCAFYDFAVHINPSGLALEVKAPDAAKEMVDALFGSAD